jgi:tetratricopeptide (TPR) repeat protein
MGRNDKVDISKLIERAHEAGDRRNYEYAIDLYLQALKLEPNHPSCRRELRAIENRMVKEKGSNFWAKAKSIFFCVLAWAFLTIKKYEQATAKAEEALKYDPGRVMAMMLLGRALVDCGHYQGSVAVFEDVRTLNAGGNNKTLLEALHELGIAYEMVDEIPKAQEVWETVLKMSPGDREGTVKLRDLSAKTMSITIENAAKSGERGKAARQTQTEAQKKEAEALDIEKGSIKTAGELKTSIDYKLEQIKKRPDDPLLYSMLGDLHKQGNNYEEAKRAYETARLKDPNNPTYLFRMHDLEISMRQNELKALEAKANSGDAAAKQRLQKERIALLEYRLTSFIEREKQYGTDSRIKFDLGSIYHELARGNAKLYDEAIKRFQTTFNDPKFRNQSGLYMAQGFKEKKQFELALKRVADTLSRMEIKNEMWKNLVYEKGDILERSGKRDEAKKTFLEIYEIDVSFRDVAKRVEDLSH